MNNERAIQLLHRLQDEQFDGIHGDERREALEMAVRALEGDGDTISRKAVMKEFSDFVRESNNSDFAPTPTWNDAVSLVGSMPSAQIATDTNDGDTIYRQQAIDAICKACSLTADYHKCDGYPEGSTWCEELVALRALPSAQPEITEDDVKEYCRKRCLIVVTSDFYNEMYRRWVSTQPRKTGKWINHRKDDGHNIADCDQCGNAIQWFDGDEIPRYCCMCGADMRGE